MENVKALKLTIVIPTYNRRERLLNQLNSLTKQKCIEQTQIIISDNCSNYDVAELLKNFEGKLNIEYRRFNVNTALHINVLSGFLYSKTQWMWLLSDDDETLPGSVEQILKDIEIAGTENVGMINYSLTGAEKCPPNEEKIVRNFHDYLRYYQEKRGGKFGLLFISIKVFNLTLLREFLPKSFEYSYNYAGFLNPSFYAFAKNIGIKFSAFPVVQWIQPSSGSAWSMLKIVQGLRTWSDMDVPASQKDKQVFQNILITGAAGSFKDFSKSCFSFENREFGKWAFKKFSRELYPFSIKKLKYTIFFYLSCWLNLKKFIHS